MKCDAVFEGGGVKGLAFIGAIQETERQGYHFDKLAGTSAGSIMASLVAAGYGGQELEQMSEELSFASFLEPSWLDKIPYVGKALTLYLKKGVYPGTPLEKWVAQKLRQKGISTFGGLPEGKLKIIASDITNGELLVIPDDLHKYGIAWQSFPISKAVQMSCMIPYFFQPVDFRGEQGKVYILDGGLLSNYPMWLFDSNTIPRWPTFGYRLRASDQHSPADIKGLISMTRAIIATMLEAHDRRHISKHDAARTMFIPADNMKSTNFGLSLAQKKELIKLGRTEASRFFKTWDFNAYILKYRGNSRVRIAAK